MSEPLESVVRLLARAESEILLLARSHPTNWQALKARLHAGWTTSERHEPSFEFSPAPDLSSLRAALAYAGGIAIREGALGAHLAARASELDEEACLVEQIGKPGFRVHAARRFARWQTGLVKDADALALTWASLLAPPESAPRVLSDDFSNPASLVSQIQSEAARYRLVVSTRVDPRLAATATVDRDCVWVRAGQLLPPQQARRIALHEIRGHALRRAASQLPQNSLSSAGFLGSDEDEEGRAIWLEQEAKLLDAGRKVELARRHLAADACHRGATFVETVDLLSRLGSPLAEALTIALRVWRGGGLAREVIYLRAYLRVSHALTQSLRVESWMARGRFSVEVALQLAAGTLAWRAPAAFEH